MKRTAVLTLIVIMSILLQGCVVGQSIDMSKAEAAEVTSSQAYRENLVVNDLRPYVVSGDKPPYFIGQYRSGIGIPYDVATEGNIPLREVLRADIAERLDRQSFPIETLHVKVDIEDWDFDTYQNGKFTYHLEVLVSDDQGQKVGSETLKENIGVTGKFWTGGKGGFERDMPGIYEKLYRGSFRASLQLAGQLEHPVRHQPLGRDIWKRRCLVCQNVIQGAPTNNQNH